MGVMEPTTNDKVNLINRGGWLVAMVTAAILVGVTVAAPIDEKKVVSGSSSQDGAHPGYVLNIIADLGSILKQRQKDLRYVNTESTTEDSEKRGIDFGLGRGYSGSQAARHMLGLQQASFAGGPGKKKRSALEKRSSSAPTPLLIAVPYQEEK